MPSVALRLDNRSRNASPVHFGRSPCGKPRRDRPEQLFGLSGWDTLTHGTFWSLLVNTGAMMIVSARSRPGVDEQAYPRTPVAAVQQVGALQAAVRAGLPRITAPVLAFRSTTDHVVPHSSMTALRRGLAPGLLTVRPLHNSFHVATLDWDAGVLEDESVRFIAGLVRGRVDVHG